MTERLIPVGSRTMPEEFINPYHFVPLSPAKSVKPRAAVIQSLIEKPRTYKNFNPTCPELLHDRYGAATIGGVRQQLTYSGRIECTLTTVSPSVFGNVHRKVRFGDKSDDTTTIVDNLSVRGRTAIAGTELKGMFSTLAEIASGSAMRILKNRAMSIRSAMRQSKSAIGMIVIRDEPGPEGKLRAVRKVLPLCLPTFSTDQFDEDGPSVYKPTLNRTQEQNEIWHVIRERRLAVEPTASLTAVYVNKGKSGSFHSKATDVVALKGSLPAIAWDANLHRPAKQQHTELTKPGLLRPAKLGRPGEKTSQRETTEWNSQDSTLAPGVVRSLGRPSVVPRSLWFDLFLPVNPAWVHDGKFDFSCENLPLIDAEQACREFDVITTQEVSTAPSSPDHSATELRGQKKFELPKKKKHKGNKGLNQGDLVCFDLFSPDQVAKVSIAQIWREGPRWLWQPGVFNDSSQRTEGGDFSLLNENPDQIPMNPHRSLVTLAEGLFGWVMDGVKDKAEQKPNDLPNAYRGRVRFSDAVSDSDLAAVQLKAETPAKGTQWHQFLQDVQEQLVENDTSGRSQPLGGYFPLKILSTPRLPFPEFYFTGSKSLRNELFNGNKNVRVQGWKFYVVNPATLNNDNSAPWQTGNFENMKQKSWVKPIRSGTRFQFHVTFDNLTHEELELLCYCLQPGTGHCHRLGFGKPLGLGAVQIETSSVQLVDNVHRICFDTDLLPSRAPSSPRTATMPLSVSALSREWSKRIGERHQLILLAGRPVRKDATVNYPFVVEVEKDNPSKTSVEKEARLYQWSVQNRGRYGAENSRLEPLSHDRPIQTFPVPQFMVKTIEQQHQSRAKPKSKRPQRQQERPHERQSESKSNLDQKAPMAQGSRDSKLPVIKLIANEQAFTYAQAKELRDFVTSLTASGVGPIHLETVLNLPAPIPSSELTFFIGFEETTKRLSCRTVTNQTGSIEPARNWIRQKVQSIRNPAK